MGRPKLDRSKMCARCGKEFRPKDWRSTHCSRTCAMTRDLPVKACAHCGREFRKNPEYSYAVWETIKYCSNTCNGLALRRERICANCGEMFYGKNGRKSQPYCSRACYWLTLRTERYPVRTRRIGQEFSFVTRRLLMERSGGACEQCGATEHLGFDHVIPCAAGGTNDLSNGQVLCRDCHDAKTRRERAELFAQ